jgi:uncharacterized membrane protein YjgN (DUF898 family)
MTELARPAPEAQQAASNEGPPGPPRLDPAAQGQAQVAIPLGFTGTGGEYFRIWIVNLLLTILTLGIYSAWAKVRKTRYFWSNTRLAGAAFQYHGNPAAILRGRILVGALFVAYSLAGRISIRAGVVAAVVLGVLAPWFFYKAMRFKLTNTTWRGVRFGFASSVGEAYGALAPAVILWVLFAAQVAMMRPGENPDPAPLFGLYAIAFALAPLLHARIKRYQVGATTWGSQRLELEPSTGAFYRLYGKTLLVALVPFVLMLGAAFLAGMSMRGSGPSSQPSVVAILVVGYSVFLVAYLVVGSYFYARLQRLLWSRTRGGPFRFSTSMRAGALMGKWAKNGLLTLLTLGLYWPYAAVDLTRYQVECMTLEGAASLDSIAAGTQGVELSAAGDGAVDFFGWDVGV